VDFHQITRDVIKGIGYDNSDYGIDYKGCAVLVAYDKQSPDIAQGVDEGKGLNLEQGAGDQGMMFGYACTETESLMPLPIYLAHRLVEKQAELRKNGKLKWLRPDAKSQVTVKYVDGKPTEIDTIVLSTQHHPDVEHKHIEQAVIEEIVKPVLAKESIPAAKGIKYLINPTGRFVIGGPQGDAGLTGRKIIVDTYGGMGRHGGGAFSGKDPSKVDRSACYAARWVAKNVVAAGLARRCEVQVAYAIGVAEPVSIMVDTFGTSTVAEAQIMKAVRETFDLTPKGIAAALDLRKPIYSATAAYGHFGRTPEKIGNGRGSATTFTWERTDKAAALKRAARG